MTVSTFKGKAIKRKRDFSKFLNILRREGAQNYLPFYEHVASGGFISTRLGFDIEKIDRVKQKKEYWQAYADFWLSLGYDCIPIEIPLKFGRVMGKDSEDHRGGAESEAGACIFNMEDFEKLEWPDENNPIDLEPFEIVGKYMPEGVKIVGGVAAGPYEVATIYLLGVMGLSYAMADQPALVDAVFGKLKKLYAKADKLLASMDVVGACRQGDDLGFKTATFMPPEFLRKHIFPIYQEMVNAAHGNNKPFILHSCGQLEEVYEDLIKIGIDGKHSFEDQITPVWKFQEKYGKRITPLGGLDVNIICRGSEKELRDYARSNIEKCFGEGKYWAFGTGNSLTNYMPVENYLTVLDEAIKITGS